MSLLNLREAEFITAQPLSMFGNETSTGPTSSRAN